MLFVPDVSRKGSMHQLDSQAPRHYSGAAVGLRIKQKKHMSDENGRHAVIPIATAQHAVTWTYAKPPRRHSVRASRYGNCAVLPPVFVAHVFLPLQSLYYREGPTARSESRGLWAVFVI